jgi:hypothetical protein
MRWEQTNKEVIMERKNLLKGMLIGLVIVLILTVYDAVSNPQESWGVVASFAIYMATTMMLTLAKKEEIINYLILMVTTVSTAVLWFGYLGLGSWRYIGYVAVIFVLTLVANKCAKGALITDDLMTKYSREVKTC